MHERPLRRVNRQRDRIVNAVADFNEFHLEHTALHPAARFNALELLILDAVFRQLDLHQGERQFRAIDRHRKLGQDVRCCTDVILMPVGKQDRPELFPILFQVFHIRDDIIDPQHVVFREHEAAVNHDHIVAVFHYRHVLADFSDPAERDDADCGLLFGAARPRSVSLSVVSQVKSILTSISFAILSFYHTIFYSIR